MVTNIKLSKTGDKFNIQVGWREVPYVDGYTRNSSGTYMWWALAYQCLTLTLLDDLLGKVTVNPASAWRHSADLYTAPSSYITA